ICESLGIKKKATTYHARHTSASIMKKSGASIMQIQEALGHSSPMVTQKYLDSFDDDVKRNLAQALTSF
ncbi:MAG: tyrosine-type recombinase/integrase, partial [Sphingobacteriales bacterium]